MDIVHDSSFLSSLSLGSLLSEYARLLLGADAAKRALHVAQTSGDINSRERAMLAHEEAISAVYRLKHDAATALLFAVRTTVELFPGRLGSCLDPLLRRELDHTQDVLVEMETRVDELETATASLEAEREGVRNVA